MPCLRWIKLIYIAQREHQARIHNDALIDRDGRLGSDVMVLRRFDRHNDRYLVARPHHGAELGVLDHRQDRLRFEFCGDLYQNRSSPSRAFDQQVGGGWDIVLVTEVLEHLPDPLPVLKKIRDVMAPGGQVVISVPQLTPDEQEGSWVYHRVLTGKPDFDSVESMDRHALPSGEVYTYYHRHYRLEEMRRLLADAGLTVAGVGAVFWQRPRRCQALWWRGMDYLVRRTAWTWLDRVMLELTGPEWGHNLLWDCRVVQK